MSGAVLAFSAADLQASATAYDPARHEAPIVIGHPKTDDPAWGWVQSLAFADGGLEATPHQVAPAFAEMVEAGAFKKISASFYAPDAPGNPAPGVYYLRHVGFLGAQPPAVKGLRSPSFGEAEEGVLEFSEWDDVANASLWRSLREWILGKFGREEADQAVPGDQVSQIEQGAQEELQQASAEDTAIAANPSPMFSDLPIEEESAVTPAEKAALEAENAQLKERLAASDQAIRDARSERVHHAHTSFAEGLIAAGKLLPAQAGVAVAALDFFASQEQAVEFGEGDEKKPLIDAFQTFLESLPKQVEFSELGRRSAGVDRDDPSAIARAAQDFQAAEAAAGRNVSIAEAVTRIFQG